MPLAADTGALIHTGPNTHRDDPAEQLSGWPGGDAVLQSRKVNFTLTNLGTTTKIYTSSTKSTIVGLATFYANLGATVDIEEGPAYRITVNLPYDEFSYLDTDPLKYALWEVIPNSVERDIFEVGIYSPAVQNGRISTTRQHVNNTIKGAVEQAARNPMMTVNLTVKKEWSSAQYLAENFLALKRLKADGVQGFTQTLKRSVIVNARTDTATYDPISEDSRGDVANLNVNPIISDADLITFYKVPTGIQIHMLPSYMRVRSVTGQDGVTLVVLAGYLIKRPTIQQVTPNKFQITQEFVWDEWLDSHYYPVFGDTSKFPMVTT